MFLPLRALDKAQSLIIIITYFSYYLHQRTRVKLFACLYESRNYDDDDEDDDED